MAVLAAMVLLPSPGLALEMATRGLARSATALSPAGFASRSEMSYGRGSLWLTVRLARPFYKLALQVNLERLRSEVAALPADAWVAHPNKIDGNTSVRLISCGGAETRSQFGIAYGIPQPGTTMGVSANNYDNTAGTANAKASFRTGGGLPNV